MRATLIGLVALFGSGRTWAQDTAGDSEAGRRVANQCQGCHGMEGRSESTPRIGGQPAAYLVAKLHAFHSGERKTANRTISLVAKILKDEQIDDVAAW
ncbi:c-type cytochrome [Rubellimicrobium rubrum]|uniref:C-type cytochrome n=1 Tax=Rubellimicrobium rubrum TaxID=2585369 RepID=A0A5C4N188_9RHOB|nr:c-type cytochrome [Rubellimicrobium rubrum]TNC51105.1 c-type cytochrome [Rubellimicrobium rubrum]